MIAAPHPILIVLFASAVAAAAAPGVRAQSLASATPTADARRAAAATPTPLDLRSSTAEAMRAAHAAQGAPDVEPLRALATPPSSDTVEGVTVSPVAPRQGRVVASTDARPLTSPNYAAADAADAPFAISVGPDQALGLTSVDNTQASGFLKINPDGGPTRTDVGLADLF